MITSQNLLAICFDFGDTLADEGSEIKDENGITLKAELIPGADTVLHELKSRGYSLCLVADGPWGTFHNVLGHYDLWDLFDARAVSEKDGVNKPDSRMFNRAMEQLGIKSKDYVRVIMVGNNLERDIKGANMLGMISVWLNWAPRRSKVPADKFEIPDYTIKLPLDLLGIVDQLEDHGLTK